MDNPHNPNNKIHVVWKEPLCGTGEFNRVSLNDPMLGTLKL